MTKKFLCIIFIFKSVILYSTTSYSLSITELISELFENDSSIKSAESAIEESSNDIKTAWAAFLPEFDAKMIKGDELKNKYNAANDQYYYEELDFTLKQKIWDFGETFSDIKQKRNAMRTAELDLQAEKSTIIVDAVDAYLGYIDAVKKYDSEIESLNAKIEATGQEESRVKKGSGMPSDVLQAKADLAASEKDKVKAEGDLRKAFNKYVKTFKTTPPEDISSMQLIELSDVGVGQLPTSVDNAVEVALSNNIDFIKKQIDLTDAELDVVSSRSGFLPSLDLESTYKHKDNVSGTREDTQEINTKLTLSIPLQPWQDMPDHKNKKLALLTAQDDLMEEEYSVTQSVSDLWQDYSLATLTRDLAKNKIVISDELLSIKKRERQLDQADAAAVTAAENAVNDDRQTLIDDETALTESAIDILEVMGVLDFASIQDVPLVVAESEEVETEATEPEQSEDTTETTEATEQVEESLEAVPVEEVVDTSEQDEANKQKLISELDSMINSGAASAEDQDQQSGDCSSNVYVGQKQEDGSWKTVCKE
jgi:adhesin transport system outer membrane protein